MDNELMKVTISDIVNRNYYISNGNPITVDNILWINPSVKKVYRYFNSTWVEIPSFDLFYQLLYMMDSVYPIKRNFRTCW